MATCMNWNGDDEPDRYEPDQPLNQRESLREIILRYYEERDNQVKRLTPKREER